LCRYKREAAGAACAWPNFSITAEKSNLSALSLAEHEIEHHLLCGLDHVIAIGCLATRGSGG
jgi:hypothetical protein